MRVFTDAERNAIYDVLVEECGAREDSRAEFLRIQNANARLEVFAVQEYRP